jgi:glycosyltransferase involved in cell wall biosynthesis
LRSGHRVQIVSQYFDPEVTAASYRLLPLAAGLAKRGHDVEVLCAVPNHPEGSVREGFRGRAQVRREIDGVGVRHVWLRPSPAKGLRARAIGYGTFALGATLAGLASRRADVVIASSPPLSVAPVGALLARRHRCPWILDVRDLWPQIAVELGEVSSPRAIRALERLERFSYRSAAAATTPTRPFADHIAAICGEPEKVRVLTNGTTRAWLEAGGSEPDRTELGPDADDGFVWTYAGNVGLSQDLETAIEAARELGPGFSLRILGTGASLDRLKQLAAERAPGLVRFHEPVQPVAAARFARASDALLVPLADVPATGRSIPIKLYDFCATGRPVIVAAPGEPARIAREAGCGLVVPPGDPDALAAAVRQLRAEPALAARLGAAGIAFARVHLRDSQVPALEALIESVVSSR